MAELEQYFLTSSTKLARLIKAAGIRRDDRVVELGAGAGTVAAQIPTAALVTLVELDAGLATDLADRFPNASVIQGDALRLVGSLRFDVLLSKLPGGATEHLLPRLRDLSFRTAVLAVDPTFSDETLDAHFVVEHVVVLDEDDFRPRQPRTSQLVKATRRATP